MDQRAMEATTKDCVIFCLRDCEMTLCETIWLLNVDGNISLFLTTTSSSKVMLDVSTADQPSKDFQNDYV